MKLITRFPHNYRQSPSLVSQMFTMERLVHSITDPTRSSSIQYACDLQHTQY